MYGHSTKRVGLVHFLLLSSCLIALVESLKDACNVKPPRLHVLPKNLTEFPSYSRGPSVGQDYTKPGVQLHQVQLQLGYPKWPQAPPYPTPSFSTPQVVPPVQYAYGFPEIDVVGHPRVRIRSNNYPFNVIGLLENGCTGTLVGPCHVLTAGHCIYSHERGEYNRFMGFHPGQNDVFRGPMVASKDFRVSEGWLWHEDFNADYAIISLQERVGSLVGWMGFGYNLEEEILGLNIAGYPADKAPGSMWFDYCSNVRFDYHAIQTINHGCEVSEGNSGSPMWVYAKDTGFREIRAIHSGARVTTRGGVPYASVITPAVTADLKSMIEQLQC